MKTLLFFAVKLLLPLLLFLSLGGGNSFAFNIAELQQEEPSTEETIQAAHTLTWAIRENSVPEFSDPSENNFFGSISEKDHFSLPNNLIHTGDNSSEYKRDIRRLISNLTFPAHFFL